MDKIEIENKYVFYNNEIWWEYEVNGMWKRFPECSQFYIDNYYMRNTNSCEMFINDLYYFILFDDNKVVVIDQKSSSNFDIRRIDMKKRPIERGVKNIFKEINKT